MFSVGLVTWQYLQSFVVTLFINHSRMCAKEITFIVLLTFHLCFPDRYYYCSRVAVSNINHRSLPKESVVKEHFWHEIIWWTATSFFVLTFLSRLCYLVSSCYVYWRWLNYPLVASLLRTSNGISKRKKPYDKRQNKLF